MKRIKQIFAFSLVVILMMNCAYKAPQNFKAYYFPIKNMTSSTMYVFENEQSKEITYWKLKYDAKQKLFNKKMYNSDFELFESAFEWIDEDGAKLAQYEYYRSGKSLLARLSRKEVFNFNQQVKDTLYYEITHTYKEIETTIQRRRTIAETAFKVAYDGKQLPAIKFKDQYIVTTKEDGKLAHEVYYNQLTTYAKKIGVVKYELVFQDGPKQVNHLIRIKKDN